MAPDTDVLLVMIGNAPSIVMVSEREAEPDAVDVEMVTG
jgi:hypothetical protein